MYMIFVRMFCWSYGLSLYTGVKSDWKGSFKRLLTHPCMIAAALGVAAMVTGIRLPAFLDRTLQYVSSCLMALSMLLIGVVLSEIKLKEVFRGDVWRFTALRLGVMPGIVFGLCKLCGVPYIVTATCTLVSGMLCRQPDGGTGGTVSRGFGAGRPFGGGEHDPVRRDHPTLVYDFAVTGLYR
ncbi:MAG: AEC family transporter [Dysosmobacter sp.]